MVFSSSLFIIYFFPIFLVFYFIVKEDYKNGVALLASIIFYAWGGKLFTILLGVTIIADYYIVKRVTITKGEERKFLFWLSIALNLGMLAYFKYANFFMENVAMLSGKGVSNWTKIALPIGISFFTFQKMSYTIDVYRGTHKPLKSIGDYALYIILFPQLIAGPIVRYSEIADELVDRKKNNTIDNKIIGLFRFAVGLGKKVLIANILGETATDIFAEDPATLTMAHAWLGALLYAFQIYFDFSGYSDMAIGIGRMLGFNFPENFNFPYIARNITEFWQRWHITLGRWMRDYLYIPLGGNRVSNQRMYINLCIVFFLSGLWHGASWNFVLWGIFHGFFLVLDRLFLIKMTEKLGDIPSVVITFIITLFGWVIFKVENLSDMVSYLGSMFGMGSGKEYLVINSQTWFILVIAFLISFAPLYPKFKDWVSRIQATVILSPQQSLTFGISTFIIISFSICYVAASNFNPFIYFRF